MISMDEINPYDINHPPTNEGWKEVEKRLTDYPSSKEYHDIGIQLVKKGLLEGREITPIAIKLRTKIYFNIESKYERIDGYKRFMGYQLAGKIEIPCYVYDKVYTGGVQYGKSMFTQSLKEK